MNSPVLDVRAGNDRRKQLVQKLAQQAAQRVKGSTVGRFGKYGTQTNGLQTGYGKPKGIGRPLGAAIGGAKASGSGLNFTDAFRSFLANGANMSAQADATSDWGVDPSEQSPYQGIPAGTPIDAASGGEQVAGGYFQTPGGGGYFQDPNGGTVGNGGEATGDPEHNAALSGATDIDPFGGFSSLVPLGGGVYLDPATGAVHGAGGADISADYWRLV